MAMSTGNPNEVTVLVFLQVKPDLQDEFMALLTPVLDAMRHETTFISAVLHRSRADPTSFMTG
jgi:quinol monooxygenase YgiN